MAQRVVGVVLFVTTVGPACAVPESTHLTRGPAHRRSVERISVFQKGTEGWRILPALPSGKVSSDERTVLSVSAENSPSYFLAPNALVTQIKSAAAQAPTPDISVEATLEVPSTCWTEQGWQCSFRLSVVGTHCSLHRSFAPTAQSAPASATSLQVNANLTWWQQGKPSDAGEWQHCSEILYPDGSVRAPMLTTFPVLPLPLSQPLVCQ